MKSIEWANGKVRLLDQTRLPIDQVVLEIDDYRDMVEAIRSLRIRGAPALGVAAAYGIVLGALAITTADRNGFLMELERVIEEIVASRPTAVNISESRRCAPGLGTKISDRVYFFHRSLVLDTERGRGGAGARRGAHPLRSISRSSSGY